MRRLAFVLAGLIVVACGADDNDASSGNGGAPGAVSEFLDDLAANGYGDYFVSDRAAVLYAQNYCDDPAPMDELDEIVEQWCGDDDLLGVDPSTIPPG